MAQAPAAAAPPSVSFAPDEKLSLKRKASSTLSAMFSRLSSRELFASSEPQQPGTPGTPASPFGQRMRKLARVVGLAQDVEQQDAEAQQGLQLSDRALDQLAEEAFPSEPPVLRQMTTLDLTGEVDLAELEQICAQTEAAQSVNLLGRARSWVFGQPQTEPMEVMAQSLPAVGPPDRKVWTAEEDAAIYQGVAQHGQKWRLVAAGVPGRSDDAVRNRWKRLEAAKAGRSTSGSADEAAPADGGFGFPGLGCCVAARPKGPRQRTLLSGDDDGDGGGGSGTRQPTRVAWSAQEDATILRVVRERGLKWNYLAGLLPTRTPHAIRNRFYRLQQQQQQQLERQQQREQQWRPFG